MRWKQAQAKLNDSIRSVYGEVMRVRGIGFQGIFNSSYMEGLGVSSSNSSIEVLTADVERLLIVKDDVIDTSEGVFKVDHAQPNASTGWTRLELKEQ